MSERRCAKCKGYFSKNDEPNANGLHSHCDVDDRTTLLQLIGSLTLCDHMGDVANDCLWALRRMGVEIADTFDEDWTVEVQRALHAQGITTLFGSSLGDDDD